MEGGKKELKNGSNYRFHNNGWGGLNIGKAREIRAKGLRQRPNQNGGTSRKLPDQGWKKKF